MPNSDIKITSENPWTFENKDQDPEEPKSALYRFAERELDAIGMLENSSPAQVHMRKRILNLIKEFSKEEYDLSAVQSVDILSKLLKFEPLSPIEDTDGWERIDETFESYLGYQNKRDGAIFSYKNKTANLRIAYRLDQIVFEERLEDGSFCRFTNECSPGFIAFPYTPIKPKYISNTEYNALVTNWTGNEEIKFIEETARHSRLPWTTTVLYFDKLFHLIGPVKTMGLVNTRISPKPKALALPGYYLAIARDDSVCIPFAPEAAEVLLEQKSKEL